MEEGLVSNMSLKSEMDDNKQKMQRNHHHQNNSVVKLVTRGKLSGHFSQSHFRKLPPLVTIYLRDIVSEQFRTEGHICLGFTKRGRYILTYTKSDGTRPPEDPLEPGYFYVMCWWEFDLHRKLKPVQDVCLFGTEVTVRDIYLSVCEWPSDESKVVVFGFNAHSSTTSRPTDHHRLMNMIPPDDYLSCIFCVTIVTNPPSKPCPPCSLAQGVDECLEHGYMLHSVFSTDPPYAFQPAFQLKIDKVLLLKSTVKLEACCIYLCTAAGEQSRSSQMLYTESAPPSSQEASIGKPRYLNYTRRYYCIPQADDEADDHQDAGDDENDADPLLPQPGAAAAEQDTEHLEEDEFDDDHRRPFFFTDLQGGYLDLVTGPRNNGQTLCVEQLTLNIKDFIHDSIHIIRPGLKLSTLDTLYKNCALVYDMIILEACPETNTVMMDIGLLVCGKCRHKISFQVSWELDTGLCCFAGGSSIDTTEVNDHSTHDCNRAWNTAMDLLAPGNSSHRVNVMTNEALPGGALEHADRCTRVLL